MARVRWERPAADQAPTDTALGAQTNGSPFRVLSCPTRDAAQSRRHRVADACMPRPKLSSKQLARLKSTFRAADCTVRDLKGSNFEIFHAELPLRSHVVVNPYYLQLGTILTAKPVNRRDKETSAIHAYLSKINKQANLAKFVL